MCGTVALGCADFRLRWLRACKACCARFMNTPAFQLASRTASLREAYHRSTGASTLLPTGAVRTAGRINSEGIFAVLSYWDQLNQWAIDAVPCSRHPACGFAVRASRVGDANLELESPRIRTSITPMPTSGRHPHRPLIFCAQAVRVTWLPPRSFHFGCPRPAHSQF